MSAPSCPCARPAWRTNTSLITGRNRAARSCSASTIESSRLLSHTRQPELELQHRPAADGAHRDESLVATRTDLRTQTASSWAFSRIATGTEKYFVDGRSRYGRN